MNVENKMAFEPKGLGGWLILPALGLIITPFRMVSQITRDLLPLLNAETWGALTTQGTNAYHPLWAPLISFEVITNIAMFGSTIWLLILFFKKSKRVPNLFVAWFLLLATVQVIDHLLANQIPLVASQNDPKSMKELSRSVIAAAIWVPYFLKSKRVKNTFIEESPSST
ncbi:MAG TPA: DUF2569 domain-containing protein [Noviherbaspirillum sp.]|nr:DUF2569 domain-containing protein [Noviherbaspirillum sp.]